MEYNKINSFYVSDSDRSSEKIFITDGSTENILIYKEDGTFDSKFKPSVFLNDIAILNNDELNLLGVLIKLTHHSLMIIIL